MATFGFPTEEKKQEPADSRTQWKTLKEAREEARPTTGKSTKAPLAPKRDD